LQRAKDYCSQWDSEQKTKISERDINVALERKKDWWLREA